MKRRNKTGTGIPPLRRPENSELLTEDSAKADLLSSNYSSVYTIEDDNLNPQVPVATAQLQDIQIDVETVKASLLALDPSSAPGPDGIHPRFLKEMADFLAGPLCQIFRLSLDTGRLPKDWKFGVVKPIFKGGGVRILTITVPCVSPLLSARCWNELSRRPSKITWTPIMLRALLNMDLLNQDLALQIS